MFLQENLSQHEQMILLSHELGHILCGHLNRAATTGPGSGILEEQEANDFSARLMRYNETCRPRRTATLIALCLVVLVLAAVVAVGAVHRENPTVYLTESGQCYHKADCKYIVGKDNTTAVTLRQAKASGYDACTWCFGHSGT